NFAQPPPSHWPATTDEMAKRLGLRAMQLVKEDGLEIWFEDSKMRRSLEKNLLKSWASINERIGEPDTPNDVPIRLLLIDTPEAVARLRPLVAEEASRWDLAGPDRAFFEATAKAGNGVWSFPPVAIVASRPIGKTEVRTRAVHDLGILRMNLACSYTGFGVPEALKEGFAGWLVLEMVKKPFGLVSHEKAALKTKIYGYGVFAGIGAAMNNADNHPSNWENLVKNAMRQMRASDTSVPEAHLDAVLARTRENFARTDYAYSWGVLSFLMDAHYPVGDAALKAQKATIWNRPKKPLAVSRQTIFLDALKTLRGHKLSFLTPAERGQKLGELLEEATGETREQRHHAFLHWSIKGL
ncbi:MAG: hypothetical protein HOM77_06735, partial [Planctomycetes bacterium]|nr:hypothetical protein [Planctomycetota bacterium]